jgi:prophage DNA circulation protein
MRFLIAFVLCCSAAFCQRAMSDQEIVMALNGISQHAARLEPMLQQVRPEEWIAKGASETYKAQLSTTLQGIGAIQSDMSALAEHPDRMSDGMKALFRVEAVHHVLDSLMGGLRKYQNPALADLIQSVAAEDSADLENLQQYLLQLAVDKEDQFRVVDQEAQRCRAMLSKQPAAPPSQNRRVQ